MLPTVFKNTKNTNNTNKVDKRYLYCIDNPNNIRLANLIGIICLILAGFGFLEFLKLNIFYLLFFSPIVLINLSSNFLGKFINLFYPGFKKETHINFTSNFWNNLDEAKVPSVDIFLPIAGEDLKILQKTWKAVSKIEYSNYNVYVLDDKGDKEAQKLASSFGFNYLSRPNKGEYKKSGNLEYGYKYASGEYVLVLDSDFAPIPTALTEALPYIVSNPKMSILQTPQYFDNTKKVHKSSPIQYGAGVVVEEFYRITQVSKSVFGLSICVGTSAIFRREAVDKVGMPKVDHTEDLRQGLMTMGEGYYVGYIPLIISEGICPDNLQSYYSQQLRWAYGSIETLFSTFIKQANLTTWGIVNFVSSALYYLAEATAPLLSLQLLCLLYFNTSSLRISWVLPFLPYFIFENFIRPKILISKSRRGVKIAGLTQMFTYMDGLIRYVIKQPIVWVSTNAKSTKRQISLNYLTNGTVTLLFSLIYILLFSLILFLKPYIILNWETYIVLGLAIYRSFVYASYSWNLLDFMHLGLIKDLENKLISGLHFHFWRVTIIILIFMSSAFLLYIIGTNGYSIYYNNYIAIH